MLSKLNDFIHNPEDPFVCFELGYQYEKMGYMAPAISLYLKAADLSTDDDFQYESLIRMGLCFLTLKSRNETVEHLFYRIISLKPDRPEAYFILSQIFENLKKWEKCYFVTCTGLEKATFNHKSLRKETNYPGEYGLWFQKALSSWWVGLTSESRDLFFDLKLNWKMNQTFSSAVQNNIQNYWPECYPCNKKQLINFKYPFDNIELIDKNYSQMFQDLFVLTMLNGKFNGTYLEIGSNDPKWSSNTYLLESKFGWKGVSIDVDKDMCKLFFEQRKNPVYCLDALHIGYEDLLVDLNFPFNIDYLQIDCEPEQHFLEILQNIPFDIYKFGVITFEHDYYVNKSNVKHISRDFLKSKGYELIISSVCSHEIGEFEDWWVHPDLIDREIRNKIISTKDTNNVLEYLFKQT